MGSIFIGPAQETYKNLFSWNKGKDCGLLCVEEDIKNKQAGLVLFLSSWQVVRMCQGVPFWVTQRASALRPFRGSSEAGVCACVCRSSVCRLERAGEGSEVLMAFVKRRSGGKRSGRSWWVECRSPSIEFPISPDSSCRRGATCHLFALFVILSLSPWRVTVQPWKSGTYLQNQPVVAGICLEEKVNFIFAL